MLLSVIKAPNSAYFLQAVVFLSPVQLKLLLAPRSKCFLHSHGGLSLSSAQSSEIVEAPGRHVMGCLTASRLVSQPPHCCWVPWSRSSAERHSHVKCVADAITLILCDGYNKRS